MPLGLVTESHVREQGGLVTNRNRKEQQGSRCIKERLSCDKYHEKTAH